MKDPDDKIKAAKTMEQVLVDAMNTPNTNFLPLHDPARLDAAEALVTTPTITPASQDKAIEFLLAIARGELALSGISLKVRAAKILLKLEQS